MSKLAAARMTSDEIVSEMIRLIGRRVYLPGDRLRELELAERFGVSRGPIREALKVLESKAFVHIEPRRGATVTRLNDQEAIEIVEIAASLFELAASKAIGCDQSFVDRMHAEWDTLQSMSTLTVPAKKFFKQTVCIGKVIVEAAGSQKLSTLISDIRIGAPETFGQFGFTTVELRTTAIEKWKQLIVAIEHSDRKEAKVMAYDIHIDSMKAALEYLD